MTQKSVRLACSLVVAVVFAACGGSSGGGGSASPPTIKAQGGKGLIGAGGIGGTIQVRSRQGGNVAVLSTGGIPTLPVLQEPAAPDLGSNPRTISADTTIESSTFPLQDDAGTATATGLWVKPGVNLTFTASTGTTVLLELTAGFRVDGTVRTTPLPTGVPATLHVKAKTAAIGPNGKIDLSGADAADTGPGFGGAGALFELLEGGINQGQILSRGGRGGSSGAGGDGKGAVFITATGSILNTGTLDSSGGEGQGGAGGKGGASQLICIGDSTSVGDALNTGRIIARGANGKTAGGEGGTAQIISCQTGRVMSSGVVDVSGGDATVDGPGGAGGLSQIASSSSQVFVAGQLLTAGGKGASSGAGGGGGKAQLLVQKTTAATPSSQGVFVTATIDLSGGDGATGGKGGEVDVEEAESDLSDPPGTTVVISGHQSLDASGGQGATNGGGGGQLFVASMRNSGATARIGSVTSELPLYANGGQGLAGDGGSAGTIGVGTDNTAPEDIAVLDRALTVTGPMYAVGGEGSVTGGAGGTFIVHEHFNLDIRGAIDASGGRGGSAKGGDGGSADIAGEGMVSTPVINASGGASQTNQGGEGGTVTVSGAQVTVASAITLDGGAGGGSYGGGGGGEITITGTTETHVTAVCSVRAGASSLPGTLGQVTINGVIQTLVDGQYRP